MGAPLLDFGSLAKKGQMSIKDLMTMPFVSMRSNIYVGIYNVNGMSFRGIYIQRPDDMVTSVSPLKLKNTVTGNVINIDKTKVGTYSFKPEIMWEILYHKVVKSIPANQTQTSIKMPVMIDGTSL